MGTVARLAPCGEETCGTTPTGVLLLLAVDCRRGGRSRSASTLHGVTKAPPTSGWAASSGTGRGRRSIDPEANPDPQRDLRPRAEVQPLERAAGVVAPQRAVPCHLGSHLQAGGAITAGAEIEGRGLRTPPPVDQPKLTSGSWARPGAVVIEAGFAEALGLHVGDRLRLAGISFRVVGTAVTAAVPGYPEVCYLSCDYSVNGPSGSPGLVWLTAADTALAARTANQPLTYFLNLKLGQPGPAPAAFVGRLRPAATQRTSRTPPIRHIRWQDISNEDAQDDRHRPAHPLHRPQGCSSCSPWRSVAVLVGGRMAEQSRRVGL